MDSDPDSQCPAEVPAEEEAPVVVPPADGSDPGLSGDAPSPDTELQAGGQAVQDGPGGEEEEEEGGADRALIKPRPPLLQLRRGTDGGRGHRRIGSQNPRALNHMSSPPTAPSPTTGTSVSGKRTMLLSNEARREIAKQARAMKEERRATLDARHKYLISRLVDAGTLAEPEVEDALISDDKFSLIDDFFVANGSKKLIFFYQTVKQNLPSTHPSFVDVAASALAQRKLFLTTGSSEPLLGKCLFFLRTTDKAITTANVQQEVNFGMLDCSDGSILNSLETLLAHIMVPALRSQQTWGSVLEGASCPDVQAFLSSVDQFVSNLSSARVNMERKFQLQHIDLPEAISQLSSPADYTAAAELEHWKRRMVTFNSLMEEVKRPLVKRTLGVLQVTKSRTLRAWREVDADITVVANEAKDNTKMLEHIPGLMSSIRMIHTVSQYYNTSERMTSLLLKVTNQMFTTCRAYLSQGVARIWDHSRPVLLQLISDCCNLNVEYQRSFQAVRDKLRENPENRQFDFSENYIFGKFDAFCRRLEKIADMASSLESLAALKHMKVEGIEKIYARYQTIVSTTKSKTYDILDHRKLETKGGNHADTQSERLFCQTERMLELLAVFESGPTSRLDLKQHYLLLLQRYSRELELLRKTYQRQRDSPPIGRNLPPVAGRILWCRQLFRKIEAPMLILKKKLDILKGPDMTKVIRSYNKIAVVLLQYEVLHLQGWGQAAESAPHCLNAALLVRHENCKEVFVNLDPVVLEVLQEARWMTKLGVTVPKVILKMSSREAQVKAQYKRLLELLQDYGSVVSRIPPFLFPLMQPFIGRVEAALSPGLTTLSWTALNTDAFIESVYQALKDLDQVSKVATDLLECRIGRLLQAMSSCCLLVLPEDSPVSPQDLLLQTDSSVQAAAVTLNWQSQQGSFQCLHPDSKQKTRCQSCLPCRFYNLIGQLCHRNTEALVKATKSSLDALRRRLHVPKYQPSSSSSSSCNNESASPPLFKASIQLAIPNIVLRPSLDDIQSTLNKLVSVVLSVSKDIPLWTYSHLQYKQQQVEQAAVRDAGDDIPVKPPVLRPLDRQLAEHKDVTKSQFDALTPFFVFTDSGETGFYRENVFPVFPLTHHALLPLQKLEVQISELPAFLTVGAIVFDTDQLKLSLTQECRLWKRAFGAALNHRSSADMDEIFSFVDGLTKRLQRPITDLDDVRGAMAALREVREAEVRIDATIGPVEESFALLNKHELLFTDGNAERVDGLTYAWKNLNALVVQNQNTLVKIQPSMKADLLSAVQSFQIHVQSFYTEYDHRGPGVEGVAPAEASERLQSFQAEFDHLWRRYTTCSGGEELFGLPVNEYPELQRIKRELSLLSKLYTLYNAVIDSVAGYYDILWADLNIEKINTELQDFQNRIRKLPKALKEWQAFRDLKKTIDDFTETCPLLYMMANKAMLPRHWTRLSELTGHSFQVESDSFSLRNIMEAPLLKHKEDIEDVCISAVKERDIEAKLKDVVAEWSSQTLSFATFRTRGELLLKGADTAEKVSMMEDSLMVLTSLLSNRYNAPFKPSIQLWVQKLSNTSEIIEKWLSVQNLWIYLEAVFVGGDIAKQLPQEAKRFQNIDKSWQRIMQRAHELPNVVQCCVGDETLSQLLPHLLEQLELCQKSLSGYLEKKRLAHLLSLFDNVNRVVFDEKTYDQIISFQSQEGETVELSHPVLAQGNVEVWLGQLLEGVRRTLHAIIRQAYLAISDPSLKLLEFQSAFPAQVGLLGIQMIWTKDAEDALVLSKSDKKIMQTTNQKFLDLLNELIDMTTRELSKNERTKYETLITIHVHQRDIFDELVRLNVRSASDFEWQKQSRFYFLEETDRCVIQITDVEFSYCNEYLGCTDRLVITPLTDRCYITLSQALGMSMGGAPAGPAGTGKTETTKDMGRCLGKYVVVFNCSDQMDYRGLGRIYKGSSNKHCSSLCFCLKSHSSSLDLPHTQDDQTIFEFTVNEQGQWEHWSNKVPEYVYPKDQVPDYSSILVPNVDNVRTDFLMQTIVKQRKAVLLIGEQGTAKTVMIKGYTGKLDPELHLSKTLNFSSATLPSMFQRTIESYIDKRMGATYGPPAGRRMTVFIDDINMPVINEWGDQITNEIVRQLMEQGGFYSLDRPGEFITVVDVQLVAAMIHPGGGRNDIPQRLKRQFSIFNCTLPSNSSIDKIFGTVAQGYFCPERGFPTEVCNLAATLVPTTRRVWQAVKAKITVEDHGKALTEHAQWESCFVDFLREAPEATGDEPEDTELEAPKVLDSVYEPIPSLDSLAERLSVFQQQYNEAVRGGAMDLVFFKDAMTHLMRISRILRTPQGNALLVGVGGSGKQSLTRLASFIAGYQTFQITLTRSYSCSNLLEDLKALYRIAGQQGKGVTFLFTDNDIKDEAFLEYMNNVLASGEVSNLFARDELDEITQDLIPVMKRQQPRRPPTSENLYDFFLSRVRSNLHVVLCFSPVGEKFRTRALKFPGLISGCTVDWFQRWPRDALVAVSHHFLSQYKDLRCSDDVKQSVVVTMGTFQDLVAEKCTEYFERFRRQTFVTPKSYLSFIDSYKVIYAEKIAHVGTLAERMKTGLCKLMEAEQSVSQLSEELVVKEQELAVASEKADGVLQEVTAKAQAAEKVKQQVQKVKDKAQIIVDEIEADKTSAESKLEAAKPALEAAEAALQTIKPADIATVRKLQKPPHLIMRIMDAVLLLFQRKIDTVTADPERPCVRPSWAEALKLMQNSAFLSMLLNFSKDSITEEVVELLTPYLEMDDYNLDSAKRICGNVAGLCSWTQAMADFFAINKEVLPLKTELSKAQEQLDAKQQELDAVQALYDAAMKEKQDLEDDAQACRRKMSNATALIDGLGGEKVRWTDSSAGFQTQIKHLVGDVLLSAGFLSYAGPFNQEYRSLLLELWKKEMEEKLIPFSPDLNVIGLLVDNATVSEWNLQGLPSDDLSIQNGIVVTKASRYPLLIDPQGQGKTWIQNRERDQQLQVTSLNHKYFRSHLEDSLSLGRPMLLEDIGEELDPVLDNILDKNYIKSGSTYKVKVGDKEVDVLKGFTLYITTKLANPAYSPEVSARTAVVDFTVTQRGLEDQLLGRVILLEKQMGDQEEQSPVKYYRLSEVEEQNTFKSTWIIINNQVYDVTKFLEEVLVLVLLWTSVHRVQLALFYTVKNVKPSNMKREPGFLYTARHQNRYFYTRLDAE
ncbi:Dynein heavy chain 5, axonemal [Collichthys lucidus]|uniref:Dynein heavy chain 5, axonemal n=1 Tax=Collichthys lucidus TaxID=240159 RepID=A0A4U5VGV0_COLLU|nr:Dynein heavy chain 5, axonemal [Collichthys lucidus]